MIDPDQHDAMMEERSRKANRISDNPADHTIFVEMGRRAVEQWWKGGDRYITTALRKVLRLTNTSQEWLEARYGFYQRLREINRKGEL